MSAPRAIVSGSSGLVGSRLLPALAALGFDVVRLVRRPTGGASDEVRWDPVAGTIDQAGLEGADALVHLAGESIAAGRWTPARKAAIRRSRVEGTRLLASALARLARPPRVLVAASAVGYYGDRGDEALTEEGPAGSGFLPEVCQAWEEAAEPVRRAGIRLVSLRIGLVLDAAGGVLARLRRPFALGLGGVVGSGRQYMSWIALEDLVRAVTHVLADERLSGPVNAVAPSPVTNREFTRALGQVLGRPTLAPLPAPLVRLVFGEMGRALLLEGARVLPARLLASGFAFRHPALPGALQAALGRQGDGGPAAR